MAQIENNFATNFVQYDISQISKLVYLTGNNYMKSEPFLALIEDSLRMRLNFIVKNAGADGQKWSDYYDAQTVGLLVDGLGALGQAQRKRLFSLVKTMVILAHRDAEHQVLLDEPGLLVKFLKTLSDMEVSAGSELR